MSPGAEELFGGFPCTDVAALNVHAWRNRSCVSLGSRRTGWGLQEAARVREASRSRLDGARKCGGPEELGREGQLESRRMLCSAAKSGVFRPIV